ncbi:hypothetical protein K7X08_016807 [Anisodus acutangulus]|uniref:Uncharacterized protein n=1 Tax=Anisodus acutangulus TaxID=402998 RepID=A0A9Q1R7L1_9SOLA|nr:hypothetical protein K7X08_016807 [Anisodus acutangulus]
MQQNQQLESTSNAKKQTQIVSIQKSIGNMQVAIPVADESKIDMDEESTAQNFFNAAREGDLSPKQKCMQPTNWLVNTKGFFFNPSPTNFLDICQKEQQLKWFKYIILFGERPVAEVPELSISQSSNENSYKPTKFYTPHKKPKIEIPDDDEYSTVPDLG